MITQEKVKHLFDYRLSGNLIRRVRVSNTKVGDEVGCVCKNGYRSVSIDCAKFNLHRLIFLWHHWHLPKYIDHKDGDKLNNKIENLRECTSSQNSWNSRLNKTNTSGIKGVCWDKTYRKWAARLGFNGIIIHVGYFDDIEEAEKAIGKARSKLHGEFSNDG